jgi:NAD(P)-dependent dehydrogenase (short-subunit alcohol dehydrogenase family)
VTGETAVVLFANSPLGRAIVTELVVAGARVSAVDADPEVTRLGPLSRGLVTAVHAPDNESLALFFLAAPVTTTIVVCRPPAGWSTLATIGLFAETVVLVEDDERDRALVEDLARRGLRINGVVAPSDLECPDDVARCVVFLASPAAAAITGAMLPVDGGRHLLASHAVPVHGRTSVHAA